MPRSPRDPTCATRVIPTFRPDRYLEPAQPGWVDAVKRLGAAADVDVGDYAGYIAALEERRRYFIAHGATSADHSHLDARAEPLEPAEAQRIYRSALSGQATADGGHRVPPAHGAGDGPDVLRRRAGDDAAPGRAPQPPPGHLRPVRRRTPATTSRSRWSSPMRCSRCWSGTAPTRTCTWCCSPWTPTSSAGRSRRWPGSTRRCTPARRGGSWTTRRRSARFQQSVTEIAGFTRLSGFIDDTRAFCSIPARHDMSRRLDAGFLAGLVAEHRLDEDEALDSLVSLVADQPRKVFKL